MLKSFTQERRNAFFQDRVRNRDQTEMIREVPEALGGPGMNDLVFFAGCTDIMRLFYLRRDSR